MTFRNSAHRFFEISPIHGCSYVGNRTLLYEALIWLAAITVCTYFCISDIVTLANKYALGETAVSVVLQRNETMSFESAAVCFDIFRPRLAESVGSAFDESTFNISLSNFAFILALTTNGSLPPMDEDVDIVMKTTFLLLASIVDYDLGIPGGGLLQYDVQVERAIQLVDAFFAQRNISYDQLIEPTARFLCKQTLMNQSSCPFADMNPYSTSCFQLCDKANITWFGYTMAIATTDDVCFSLNSVEKVFRSSTDTFIFSGILLSHASRLIRDWGEPIDIIEGYGPAKLIFDMRNGEGLLDPRNADSLALVSEETGMLVGVEFDSQFLAYNRSARPCGSESAAECALSRCLPEVRMSVDGCWPLAGFATMPRGEKVCGKRYTNAQIQAIKNNASSYVSTWEMCVFKTCSIPQCDTLQYAYVSVPSTYGAGVNVTLYQAKLSYAILTEYPIMDFGAFLGAFGGTLGLWLGSSIISLVHIPVFIVCEFVNSVYKSKNRGKSIAASFEVAETLKTSSKQNPADVFACDITYI